MRLVYASTPARETQRPITGEAKNEEAPPERGFQNSQPSAISFAAALARLLGLLPGPLPATLLLLLTRLLLTGVLRILVGHAVLRVVPPRWPNLAQTGAQRAASSRDGKRFAALQIAIAHKCERDLWLGY